MCESSEGSAPASAPGDQGGPAGRAQRVEACCVGTGTPLTLLPKEHCPQPKRLSVPLYPNLTRGGGYLGGARIPLRLLRVVVLGGYVVPDGCLSGMVHVRIVI
jgi:hypothetical protein